MVEVSESSSSLETVTAFCSSNQPLSCAAGCFFPAALPLAPPLPFRAGAAFASSLAFAFTFARTSCA
jgi:hypothetical protein